MLSPLPIRWCLVQHASQWVELINWHIFRGNTQFIQKLPLCSISYPWKVLNMKVNKSCWTRVQGSLQHPYTCRERERERERERPRAFSSISSDSRYSGWLQQVFVHMRGNVTFVADLCCIYKRGKKIKIINEEYRNLNALQCLLQLRKGK